MQNEKELNEAFMKKVSEGHISKEEEALYYIMRVQRLKERAEFCKKEDAFLNKESKSPIDTTVESLETDMPPFEEE
jgi:hypothetical protein